MLVPSDTLYWRFSSVLAGIVTVGVFGYSWFYAVTTYGWFLGLAFGWLPAAILAALAYFATLALWPLAALAGIFYWMANR